MLGNPAERGNFGSDPGLGGHGYDTRDEGCAPLEGGRLLAQAQRVEPVVARQAAMDTQGPQAAAFDMGTWERARRSHPRPHAPASGASWQAGDEPGGDGPARPASSQPGFARLATAPPAARRRSSKRQRSATLSSRAPARAWARGQSADRSHLSEAALLACQSGAREQHRRAATAGGRRPWPRRARPGSRREGPSGHQHKDAAWALARRLAPAGSGRSQPRAASRARCVGRTAERRTAGAARSTVPRMTTD